MNDCNLEIEKQVALAQNDTPIKPYFKPCLEELGDLRTVTLGATGGACESSVSGNPELDPFLGC